MLNALFDHIKNHKSWYSLGAILLLIVVSTFSYYRVPNFDDVTGELTGNVRGERQSIQIVTPKPGQSVKAGERMVIEWEAPSSVYKNNSSHSIYLFPKEGPGNLIIRKVRESSYVWDVPIDLFGTYKIAINGSGGKVRMNDPFNIERPEVDEGAKSDEESDAKKDPVAEGNSPTGVLNVGVDEIQGGFTIANVNNLIIADKNASSCGPKQPNGYYICDQALPIGTYEVVFKSVDAFTTPSNIFVDLSQVGAMALGSYVASPEETETKEEPVVEGDKTEDGPHEEAVMVEDTHEEAILIDETPLVEVEPFVEEELLIDPVVEELELPIEEEPVAPPVQAGDLKAVSEGNPQANILIHGASNQFVSKYVFHSQDEDWKVEKLTIVNDTVGDNFGDNLDMNLTISDVTIKYPDQNGVIQSKTSPLSGGVAEFDNLDFYVSAGNYPLLDVYVNIRPMALVGETLSGKTFRVGLKNTGNDATSFRAVGQSSNDMIHFAGAPASEVINSAGVNSFVIRKSVPSFANVSASTSLNNAEKTLMSFSVSANNAGSVSFARFVFDVYTTDADAGGELDLSNFKLYRGNNIVTGVNIFGSISGDVGNGAGSFGSTDQSIIVSFDHEETVDAGANRIYSLKASVIGSQIDDVVYTRLAPGDENVPVAGILATSVCGAGNTTLCSTGNGNTGRIYDTGYNEALLWTIATEFSDTDTAGRNIIWSDKSADNHIYPTVAAGTVTQATGSSDWTNGYLLDISMLNPHVLKK